MGCKHAIWQSLAQFYGLDAPMRTWHLTYETNRHRFGRRTQPPCDQQFIGETVHSNLSHLHLSSADIGSDCGDLRASLSQVQGR